MRILHVIANLAPRYGGPSKACVDMAASLAALGHEVDVFTTDQDGIGRLNVPTNGPQNVRGVRIYYFQSTLRRAWPISIALWHALRQQIPNYDIVHIHSLYMYHGAVAGHYCRKYRVPYIIRPHGTLDPFIRQRHRFRKSIYEALVERRNFRGAAGIHFTADEERVLATPHIESPSSFVVPLGINIDEYGNMPAAGTFRARYPEIGNRKIILHLGRINFKKGLDILVDAFARVVDKYNDVHLVLAGPDNEGYGAQIRRRVAERGVAGRTTFTGILKGEPKLAALRDATVFALPSYSENFGIAVVEAMACGLPVVISDKVNIWRDVTRGGAGLVTRCDADSCAAKLLEVLANEARAQEMGEHGRTLASTQFNWPIVGAQLEAMYQDILSRSAGSSVKSKYASASR